LQKASLRWRVLGGAAAASSRPSLSSKETELEADQGELVEDLRDGLGLPLTEAADGEVFGPQVAGRPDGVEAVGCGLLWTAAGAAPHEMPSQVELEQHGGMAAGAADGAIVPQSEAEGLEIRAIDEGGDRAQRVRTIDEVIDRRGGEGRSLHDPIL